MLNKGKTISLFIASCRGRQVPVPYFYSRYLFLCSRQPDLSWTESRAWTPSQRMVSGEEWTKDITKSEDGLRRRMDKGHNKGAFL